MPLIRSFGYALQGIWASIKGRNMRIHLVALIAVLAAIMHYRIRGGDLAVLIICLAMVPAAEIFNTAIEKLCDLTAEVNDLAFPDPRIKLIKDLAAGGVMLLVIGAVAVGLVILFPYIF